MIAVEAAMSPFTLKGPALGGSLPVDLATAPLALLGPLEMWAGRALGFVQLRNGEGSAALHA